MRYEILATGSDGNCVIINDTLMIDCGVPYKTIEPYLEKLQLVLLTHMHGDHYNPSTIRRMAYDRPALRFGCCSWMVPALIDAGVKKTQIDVFNLDKWGTYNLKKRPWISPFKLSHNADTSTLASFTSLRTAERCLSARIPMLRETKTEKLSRGTIRAPQKSEAEPILASRLRWPSNGEAATSRKGKSAFSTRRLTPSKFSERRGK